MQITDMYVDKSMQLDPIMDLFDGWRQERLVVWHSLQGPDARSLILGGNNRHRRPCKPIDDFYDTHV